MQTMTTKTCRIYETLGCFYVCDYLPTTINVESGRDNETRDAAIKMARELGFTHEVSNGRTLPLATNAELLAEFADGKFDAELEAHATAERARKDRANAARKVKRDWAQARRAAYASVGMKRTASGWE
jgi:hypothetical protein